MHRIDKRPEEEGGDGEEGIGAVDGEGRSWEAWPCREVSSRHLL